MGPQVPDEYGATLPGSPDPRRLAPGGQPLAAGSLFAGRYRIEKELGSGGFGTVYRAFDESPLQRRVALKLILMDRHGTVESASEARARFLVEARLAGGLSHPHIAAIFDVGEAGDMLYMTQELARGQDLQRILLASGALPLKRVLAIARQVCEGLSHAHARGIVHRDIKPGNIVVDPEDRVKITDFGVAQAPRPEGSTVEGRTVGTPGYMSPEQLLSERVDARADVFAVGCVLYHMLTGRPPFEGKTFPSIVDKTLHDIPPDPSRVRDDLPRALDRIVGRAMRKGADERYSNVSLLEQDLLQYEQFGYLLEAPQGAEAVAAAMERGDCILFLGPRVPVPGDGRPPRPAEELIAEHLRERLRGNARESRLSRVAQNLEMELGRPEMLRHLAAAVRDPAVSPREIVRRVARLPFPVFVATSHDGFLEEELNRAGHKVRRVLDCRSVPDDVRGDPLLIRMFGSVDEDRSVIVTEDDLWEFFGSFQSVSDAFKSLLATRHILFVGCDPEDEAFRHLYAEIMRFRQGRPQGCYLPAGDVSIDALRWAERKGLKLVDAEAGAFLTLLEETAVARRRAAAGREPAAPRPALPARPYKFLNYFEAADEAIFFGRDAESRKLASKIHAYPLNLLYAASGSGKTSLIQAGVAPLLQREGYLTAYARVYDDPEAEIRRAALVASRVSPESETALPLAQFLSQLAAHAGHPLVVFVDQFEELFIRYDREIRDRFAAALQACVEGGRGRVRFVLSLREDYLARLSEFREKIPTIFHNEFRLDPLSPDQARAAIVEPAQQLGLEVEPALVERLLSDLAREGIDPPQLQIVCDTLYDALEPGHRSLTLKAYSALGETRKILTNYLDRVLRELSPAEREAAREVLKSLVTSEETKTISRAGDLVRMVGRPEADIERILALLSERRLIRRVQREEGVWFELAHEYLVEEIGHWLSEKERDLKKLRELLEQAVRNQRQLGLLMPAAQLKMIQAHEDDLNLSREERQLLRTSEQSLHRRRRRLAIAAAATLVAMLIGGVAWRYAYLAGHVFVESEDREMKSLASGEGTTHRFEGISVLAGAPGRSWLDARLGFPRPLYQTDFELSQIEPRFRDQMKAGLLLPRQADIGRAVFDRLRSDEKVRYLAMVEGMEAAGVMADQLYRDPSAIPGDLDHLSDFLGHSGIQDDRIVTLALANMMRERGDEINFRSPEPDERTLQAANLLSALPAEQVRAALGPYLADARTLPDALALLGAVGHPDDAALVIPYLTHEDSEIKSVAVYAIRNLAPCEHMGRFRRMYADPMVSGFGGAGTMTFRYAAFDILSSCGTGGDVALIEHDARTARMGDPEAVPIMLKLGGAAAAPAVFRTLSLPEYQQYWGYALDGLEFPQLIPYLRDRLTDAKAPVRAEAANLLAKRGLQDGVSEAFEIARDETQPQDVRAEAISALQWFRNPRIRDVLIGLLGGSRSKDAGLRQGVLTALGRYDDRASLDSLIAALGSGDAKGRWGALGGLRNAHSPSAQQLLKERLPALDPASRVFVASCLFDHGDSTAAAVPLEFLKVQADSVSDYDANLRALLVLARAWRARPVVEVADHLRDPCLEIRIAATLALLEHPDQAATRSKLQAMSKERDYVPRRAASVALWAARVTARADSISAGALAAIGAGRLSAARQQLELVGGYARIVGDGLSRWYGPTIAEHFFELTLVNARLRLAEGILGGRTGALTHLREPLRARPELLAEVLRDPAFKSFESSYRFRVETGLQPPLDVSDDALSTPSPSRVLGANRRR